MPIESFRQPALGENPNITLLTPAHGGHVGFLSLFVEGEDRYWAENRLLDWCRLHSCSR